jgi:hypothetical protein
MKTISVMALPKVNLTWKQKVFPKRPLSLVLRAGSGMRTNLPSLSQTPLDQTLPGQTQSSEPLTREADPGPTATHEQGKPGAEQAPC